MISATSSLSPYSYQPPSQNRAAGGESVDALQKSAANKDAGVTSPKNDPQIQAAQKDPKQAQEQKLIDELEKIDQRVHTHEQAHLSAAADLAMSGATFTYKRGPDGHQYAVGGEVQIDVSPGKTPQETVSKAQRIKAAALAPSDPSAQDRAVAAQATQMALAAQQELAAQRLQGAEETDKPPAANDSDVRSATGKTPEIEKPAMQKYRQNAANIPQTSGIFVNSYA